MVVFSDRRFIKFNKLTAVLSVLLTVAIAETTVFTTIARSNNLHPLEVTQPDHLLPPASSDRPLSAFEISRIEREIERIERQAKTQLATGDVEGAFTLWYRELRLQRAVGNLAEVSALGRIGSIAWQQNRGFDLRAIAKRLTKIYTAAATTNNLTPALLQELGTAYQQVRYLDRAIDIYQQIVNRARATEDLELERESLEILGKLYLDLFDYTEAAKVYEELLAKADLELADDEAIYLNKLATIYDRNGQLKRAIAVKTRLAEKYTREQNTKELAAIELAIARDYKELNSPKKAIAYYRQAYSFAADTQQLALATEALSELALLYQQQGKIEEAIATYQQQIKLQQQAYDYYGWMETCDRLGKIYRDLNNYDRAKFFYQQGLKLALSLNYRVNYFTNQIEQIKK